MGDGFSEGVEIGNPAGFIADAIDRGLNQTNALAEFRSAGGAMRDTYWSQLYGQVEDSIARSDFQSGLDPFALPDAASYSEWSMGRGGEYATQVNVFFRDKGSDITGTMPYLYKTAEPHTPIEAMMAAQNDYFADDVTDIGGSGEGQVFQGTWPNNIYVTVPWSP